jgi:hypothetical protein
MTAVWLITACMALVLVIGVLRGKPGSAITDVVVLVFVFGLIAIIDLVLSRFIDTRDIGWTLAGVISFGFALDAVYGLMAPERQRRRDKRLRELTQRRRA